MKQSLKSKDGLTSFQNFFDKMNNLTDKHVPLHKLTRKRIKILTKPWITKEIQEAIHKRNKLQILFKNTKHPTLKNHTSKNSKNIEI